APCARLATNVRATHNVSQRGEPARKRRAPFETPAGRKPSMKRQMKRPSLAGLGSLLALGLLASGSTIACAQDFKPTAQDSLVPKQSKLEMVWNEGEFTEGPAPDADGAILFSDIGNRIYRFDPRSRQTSVFRSPSGKSNGLKFNPQGRLIACEGAAPG